MGMVECEIYAAICRARVRNVNNEGKMNEISNAIDVSFFGKMVHFAGQRSSEENTSLNKANTLRTMRA